MFYGHNWFLGQSIEVQFAKLQSTIAFNTMRVTGKLNKNSFRNRKELENSDIQTILWRSFFIFSESREMNSSNFGKRDQKIIIF